MKGILSQFSRSAPKHMIAEAWEITPSGRHLTTLENACVAGLVEELYGYFALQIGEPQRDLLVNSLITNKIKVGRSRRCDVQADLRSLPFQSSSVDLVVNVHALEFSSHPGAIVRESFRILRPEGHLIVIGFNPAGLYGLRQRFDLSGQYPWHGDFIFLQRLKDWYAVLGLTVRHGYNLGFAPPGLGASSDWLRNKLEHAGQRWWPLLGGVYVIDAIKRVPAMRRLRPAWRREFQNIKQPVTIPEQGGNIG